MANWSDLKSAVSSIIKTNGAQQITGQLLQNVLNNIISNVGENAAFAGIATPDTNPGVPDGNVFYLAEKAGTYSNFNGIKISLGEAAILEWKGNWVKKTTGFASKEKLAELSSDFFSLSSTIQLEKTSENIVGTTNKGYINADANVMYFLDTDSSIMYVPANKGDVFNVKIPTTRSSGWSVAFSTSIGYGMTVEGYYKTEINEQYETNLKMPFDGYLLVVYMTNDGLPTLTKSIVKSKADIISSLESDNNAIKDVLGLEVNEYDNRGVTSFGYVNSDSNKMFLLESSDKSIIYAYVKKGEKIYVNIPKTTSFGRVISYADKIESGADIRSWVDAPSGVRYETEFVNTEDDGYLLICYINANGTPKLVITDTYSDYNKTKEEVAGLLGLESKLYSEGSITFEDLEEQGGEEYYSYNDIGLVHKANKEEVFNQIKLNFNTLEGLTPDTIGSLIVKKGKSISANGGTIIKQIDNIRNYDEFPQSGLYTIELDSNVTIEQGEYLWVYFTQNVSMRVWSTVGTNGKRQGMYFQGRVSDYKYSSAMTLGIKEGDISSIKNRVNNIEDILGINDDDTQSLFNKPLVGLIDDLYVPVGIKQKFYYNEFIYGDESSCNNTLNHNIQTRINSASVGLDCVADSEGFVIYSHTEGDYIITISLYDSKMNLQWEGDVNLHIYKPKSASNKSILMLGASWIDINSGNKGYTPYINDAFNELGISMNFIGTRDAGTSGLKHEGIGGYGYITFTTAPSSVRFKFYYDLEPSISNSDIYSNNGSNYQLFERGSGYITMSRISGSTEPKGNVLTKVSGTGSSSINFNSWTLGGSNPLWNTVTNKLDFTHYRKDLCGYSSELEYCNIQLGVNDCMGVLKSTKSEWKPYIDAAITLFDEILRDSPNCKIIVGIPAMGAPGVTAWSYLLGLSNGSKRTFQVNSYYMRTYLFEAIRNRSDYNKNIFLGQSLIGINRWHGYLHYDAREIYCKVSLSESSINQLKSFNFQATHPFVRIKDSEEREIINTANIVRYDRRGYLVLKEYPGNWDTYDQEFTSEPTELPPSGYIELHREVNGIPTVIPFSQCNRLDNKLEEHSFVNPTHPADYGYRQMAYCAANQIAYLISKD